MAVYTDHALASYTEKALAAHTDGSRANAAMLYPLIHR